MLQRNYCRRTFLLIAILTAYVGFQPSNASKVLQLSPVHPAYTAPDFDSAEAACNADGARLWQPRNVDALNSILKMHGSYLGSMTTAAHLDWISDSSEVSFTAVGLKARSTALYS